MIGLVVDSNSQLPDELAQRFGIEVVALTVTVNGMDHLEGVDLDADAFYAAWSEGRVPEISTSQPAPGAFVAAYTRLIDRGCDQILSVHLASSMSGTVNAARLAAQLIDSESGVEIAVVDSRTASFGISCCIWAAAEAIAEGADLATAAAVALDRSSTLHSSFVVGVPALVDRSGRAAGLGATAAAQQGIAVLAMTGPDLSILATVSELDEAVAAMVDDALGWSPSSSDGLRIAVGHSDASSRPMSDALIAALSDHRLVASIVEYRIGPSVGAHTGPGTAGLFVF